MTQKETGPPVYEILGACVRPRFSDPAFAAELEADYGAFRTDAPIGPVVDLEPPHGLAPELAVQAVLSRALALVDDYAVLHGAVAATEKGAVILAGPPGAGKTTLLTALLSEGCLFLSDDFCPVHWKTGLVHPFPRSLHMGGAHGKKRVPAREFKAFDQPVKPHILVCIQPEQKGPLPVVLWVWSRDGDPKPAQELKELQGVEVEPIPDRPGNWKVSYYPGRGLGRSVGRVLQSQGEGVHAFRTDRPEPDFSAIPRLASLEVHEAVFSCLADIKNRGGPARLNFLPGQWFGRLCGIFGRVKCYGLRPGNLEQTKELLKGLV